MSQTIQFKDGLRLGKSELNRLQSVALDNISALGSALTQSLPAVVSATGGALTTELQVTAGATNVTVAPGSALLKNGTFLTLSAATTVAVSTSVTDRPVILRADSTPYASGTMSLAADRVTLTYVPAAGSSLTGASIYSPNDAVRLVNGGSDLGTFRVLTVSTNTLVLADVVSGSGTLTGLLHAPAGKFYTGYPAGTTTDLLSYDSAGLRVETAGYTPAANEILLATVTRGASGPPVVTDARAVLRPRGFNDINNSMVSVTAGIAESKLALSQDLLKAKAIGPYFNVTADSRIATTTPDLYVTRNNELRRVMVESDIVIPALTGLSVTPAATSIAAGGTVALTASSTAQAGATVTYTFTSSNTSVATVTSTGASATVTSVGEGEAYITVRATAPAFGSYVAANESEVVPIFVTGVSSSSILQTLTLSPASPLSLMLSSAATSITASTTSPVGATPAVTWLWQLEPGSENLVTLSATNTASITVTPKAAGTARIRVTASAPASGSFAATSLTTVLTVNVGLGLALTAEPGDNPIRVTFNRTDAGANVQANIRWGIGGTFTYANPTATLTISSDDSSATYSANALTGQAFYDANNVKYLITANTASTASPKTVTLAKINSTDPNPTAGSFVIRSHATSYTCTILSADGTQVFGSPANFSLANRVWVVFPTGIVQGTTYKFRLTSSNPNLSPSSLNNDRNVVWGSGTGGTVAIPSPWISATSTSGSVTFSWSLLTSAGYSVATMDYQIQTRIGGGSWGPWRPVYDSAPGATSVSYTVTTNASTLVEARVRIVGLDGSTLINNPVSGYDGEAQATSLASASQGTPMQLHYPFVFSASSTWSLLPGTTNRWILPLSQVITVAGTSQNIPTYFTTAVTVERIDIGFPNTPLSQPAGTASVKPIVYPVSNEGYQIAGNIVYQGLAQFQSAQNLNTQLPLNANGEARVALEYVTSGDPNDLNPQGSGYVTVHFRTATG